MRIHWAGSYLYEDETRSFGHQVIERRRNSQGQRLGWRHIQVALSSFLAIISVGAAQAAFAADAGKIAASGNGAGCACLLGLSWPVRGRPSGRGLPSPGRPERRLSASAVERPMRLNRIERVVSALPLKGDVVTARTARYA